MMKDDKFDQINEALDTSIESSITEIKKDAVPIPKQDTNDVTKDYEYTRGNLYYLIEKGQEALNGIMELAAESDGPRAYEVAGQLLKSVGDNTDKLLDLQKKLKELEEETGKPIGNVTNNAVFVGSTTELQKLLKKGLLNNK